MSKNRNPLNALFQNIPQGRRELFYRTAEKIGWSRERIKALLDNERRGKLHN